MTLEFSVVFCFCHAISRKFSQTVVVLKGPINYVRWKHDFHFWWRIQPCSQIDSTLSHRGFFVKQNFCKNVYPTFLQISSCKFLIQLASWVAQYRCISRIYWAIVTNSCNRVRVGKFSPHIKLWCQVDFASSRSRTSPKSALFSQTLGSRWCFLFWHWLQFCCFDS